MGRELASLEGASKPQATWRYHVSVDDVFGSMFAPAESGTERIGPGLFAFLSELNGAFGCGVDLYVFEHGTVGGRKKSLAEVPEALGEVFHARPWLRVGPHAECYALPPFEQSVRQQEAMLARVYQQIDRLAGSDARSRWLRLHYFSECYELAPYLTSMGVGSLLLTDKEAVAYRLDSAGREELQRNGLARHGGMVLRRSFPRVEHLVDEGWEDTRLRTALLERLQQHGYVALFTHEVDLGRAEVREGLMRCVGMLEELGAVPV